MASNFPVALDSDGNVLYIISGEVVNNSNRPLEKSTQGQDQMILFLRKIGFDI